MHDFYGNPLFLTTLESVVELYPTESENSVWSQIETRSEQDAVEHEIRKRKKNILHNAGKNNFLLHLLY